MVQNLSDIDISLITCPCFVISHDKTLALKIRTADLLRLPLVKHWYGTAAAWEREPATVVVLAREVMSFQTLKLWNDKIRSHGYKDMYTLS